MTKALSTLLLCVFSLFIISPVSAQKNENEITIQLNDGKAITINQAFVDSMLQKLNSSADFQKLIISKGWGDKLRGSDGSISLSGDTIRLFKNKDSISISGSPLVFIRSFMNDRTYLGVKSVQEDKGARVVEVLEGSPADKAGLKKDDIITAVEDKIIDGPEKLGEVIKEMKPDQEVKLTILRDGKKKVLSAVLGKDSSTAFGGGNMPNFWRYLNPQTPQTMPRSFRMEPYSRPFTVPSAPKLGMQVQDTEEGNGVTVLKITDGSPAGNSGVKEGDLITEVDGKKVANVADLIREAKPERGKEYKLKVTRDKKVLNLTVRIPKELRKADL